MSVRPTTTDVLICAGLVGLVIALYANSLSCGFHLDDYRNIVDNQAIRISDLGLESLRAAAAASTIERSRPLAYLSFALNYRLGGLDVRGFHVFNIAVHALATLGLFAAARLSVASLSSSSTATGSATRIALVCAAAWCAHPLNVQAVTYIVQRMTSMAAMFSIWGAVFLLLSTRGGPGRRALWLSAAAASLAAGASCKMTTVAVVPAVLLSGLLRLRNERLQDSILVGLGASAALGIGVLRLQPDLVAPSGLLGELVSTSAVEWLSVSRALSTLLGIALLPLPSLLNIDHDLAPSISLWEPATGLPATLAPIALLTSPLLLRRRRPLAAVALTWAALPLVLEHAVVRQDPIFEHRFYLPGMGLSLLVGLAFEELWQKYPQRHKWLGAAAGVVLAALSLSTIVRNTAWSDELTLWGDAVAKSPQKVRAHSNWTYALHRAGLVDQAQEAYLAMVAVPDRDARDTRYKANRAIRLGHLDDAVAFLDRCLEEYPRDCDAMLLKAEAHLRRGDLAESADAARFVRSDCAWTAYYASQLLPIEQALEARASEIQPTAGVSSPKAIFERAVWLASVGSHDQAAELYQGLIETGYGTAPVLTNFGYCRLDVGRSDEAIEAFRAALAATPSYGAALYGLGLAHRARGEDDEARQAFLAFLEVAAPGDRYRDLASRHLEELGPK